MKSTDFIYEEQKCPFPRSAVQSKLYHGTVSHFETFNRPAHGIYVTPNKHWASTHYGNTIIELYADVRKVKRLDYLDPAEDKIIDLFYDRNYSKLAPILANWAAEGYNCCLFGGESDSMVLFGNVRIVNANTLKPM